MDRRTFVAAAAAAPFATAVSPVALAQARTYAPATSDWRTFEVVTRLDIANAGPGTRAWIPVPNVNNDWQQSSPSTWSGNLREAALVTDPASGAQMIAVAWSDTEKAPYLEVTSRFRARNRSIDWSRKTRPAAPSDLGDHLKPTALLPTDGIVAKTAASAVSGKTSDLDKARALYDWVVHNTYRDPAVRGCGVGDIKGMLETGNLGGKCADLNALFVGLCRSVGVPARDLYGIRVAKSAFGYKELGAGSTDISKAQHCRAEVWLTDYGWVAMDPADVAKVMRQETSVWIREPRNALVAPVYGALFGAWEGNWMGYNAAHDVALPGSKGAKLGFLMYPQAETRGERVDSLDPDTFKYKITVAA
ncbi:MAG: transglutaminase domain-containing protein [Burkholderiales bacterium]|nr:transglutaminase domain-containing protein [Burkholderiales bacterium]